MGMWGGATLLLPDVAVSCRAAAPADARKPWVRGQCPLSPPGRQWSLPVGPSLGLQLPVDFPAQPAPDHPAQPRASLIQFRLLLTCSRARPCQAPQTPLA